MDKTPERRLPFQRMAFQREYLLGLSKADFDSMICREFPELFADRNKTMSETCMCQGFDCGPGWHSILYDLCQQIDFASKKMGMKVKVTQVKEKFGALRFYWQAEPRRSKLQRIWDKTLSARPIRLPNMALDIIASLVGSATNISARTCEQCGEWGKTYKIKGWLSTLCKEHAIKKAESQGVPLTEPKPVDDE